jgi:hypothetical protein
LRAFFEQQSDYRSSPHETGKTGGEVRAKKVSFGVRPARAMFRVQTMAGEIIDAMLASMKLIGLDDEYFNKVHRSQDLTFFKLADSDSRRVLHVDSSNVVFTRDEYDFAGGIDLAEAMKDCEKVLKALDGQLQIRAIRESLNKTSNRASSTGSRALGGDFSI